MEIESRTYRGPAIYSIWNTETGKLYFGQAINYGKRALAHLNAFKANRHFNRHLQRVYNLDPSKLIMAPIEITSEQELTTREKFWINFMDTLNESKGYNMIEGGRLIKPIPYTQERREKLSRSIRETLNSEEYTEYRERCSKRLSDNPLMKGKSHTDNWKSKMVEIRAKKKAQGIRLLPGKTIKVNVYELDTNKFVGTFVSIKDVQKEYNISNTLLFGRKPKGDWVSFNINIRNLKIERYE